MEVGTEKEEKKGEERKKDKIDFVVGNFTSREETMKRNVVVRDKVQLK